VNRDIASLFVSRESITACWAWESAPMERASRETASELLNRRLKYSSSSTSSPPREDIRDPRESNAVTFKFISSRKSVTEAFSACSDLVREEVVTLQARSVLVASYRSTPVSVLLTGHSQLKSVELEPVAVQRASGWQGEETTQLWVSAEASVVGMVVVVLCTEQAGSSGQVGAVTLLRLYTVAGL